MFKTGDKATVVALTMEMEGMPEMLGESCIVVSVSQQGEYAKVAHSKELDGDAFLYHVSSEGLRAYQEVSVPGPETAQDAITAPETPASTLPASEGLKTDSAASDVQGA